MRRHQGSRGQIMERLGGKLEEAKESAAKPRSETELLMIPTGLVGVCISLPKLNSKYLTRYLSSNIRCARAVLYSDPSAWMRQGFGIV